MSFETKRTTSALPKISLILWTVCGCHILSSEGTLRRDSMPAPWFNTPGTMNASWDVPPPRGISRWACLGDFYKIPLPCCLNRLARGVPSGPVRRSEGLNILPSSRGSWCVADLLHPTRSRRLVCPRTQSSPTSVGCICQDNLPSENHAYSHALLEPLWVFPRGQSCDTGLAHPDAKASMTPRMGQNLWFQPVLHGSHVEVCYPTRTRGSRNTFGLMFNG